MSKSSIAFLKADHQNQLTLSYSMQSLIKKLLLTTLKDETEIEK